MNNIIKPRKYKTVFIAINKLKTRESIIIQHKSGKHEQFLKVWKRADGRFKANVSNNGKKYFPFYIHVNDDTIAIKALQTI